MKEGTITVHKTNCPNIHTMGKSRKIKVSWNVPQKDIRKINVYVEDKLAMVEQILNSLLKFNINVLSINLKPHKRSILITLKIKINSETDVKKTVEILKTLEHVNYIDVQKIK